MSTFAGAAVLFVVVLQTYFMILEMFLWTRPPGLRAFGLTADFAQSTRVLAANQGLYNGFLAAGLLWGFLSGSTGWGVRLFFAGCVVVAGVFGAITASRKILFVQAVPGAIALIATWVAGH